MKRLLWAALAVLLLFGLTTTAHAHGAKIEYTIDMTVEIRAAYDSGKPMAGAQVTVYAPNNPAQPWLTGVCDQDGRFTFVPDPSLPGTWDVQVRLAGHGDMLHITIGQDGATGGSSGFGGLQLVLMGATTVWGFVGTALYLSRRTLPAKGED